MNETNLQQSGLSGFRSMHAAAVAGGSGMSGVAAAKWNRPVDGGRPLANEKAIVKYPSDEQPVQGRPRLFSGATVHGGLVFVAGKGEHGEGDIKVHTARVLDKIEAELVRAGSSMGKVLKVNVYLHNLRDYDGMNEAYRGRFGDNPPARSTVACYAGIPGNSLVEMDCIAAL